MKRARRLRVSCLAPVLLVSLLLPGIAGSKATPDVPQSAPMMIAVTVHDLPQDTAEVWLHRLVLQPGVQIPALEQPGPTLLVVEKGDVTLTTDQPVVRRNAVETMPVVSAGTPAASGPQDTTLTVGEGASTPGGTLMGMRNDGEQAAELLVLTVNSAGRGMQLITDDATPVADPSGWTAELVAFGVASFANLGGVLTIERDVVSPNASSYSSTFNGVEVGTMEQGSALVTYHAGTGLHLPGHPAAPEGFATADPVDIAEGERVDLTEGDSYIASSASLTWRAGSDEPVIILRAQVIPMPAPS